MRLYPDEQQKVLLERHFGSCRFVWNHFLEARNLYYAKHMNNKKKLMGKKKGSENRKKQIVKVQKIHQQTRDARTDFNHKVSTAIAKHYGTVVMESLNIHGMQRNHHLAKSMSDQGRHQFKIGNTMSLRSSDSSRIGLSVLRKS